MTGTGGSGQERKKGDSFPAALTRYLLPYEKRILATRKHPSVLRGPALLVLAALAAASLITVQAQAGSIVLVAWVACAAVAGRLMWKLIAWQRTYLVVTDHRVGLLTGVLNRRIAMIPLTKIADLKVEQPLPGRLLGYGTFVIDSAGKDHPLARIEYVPSPARVCVVITAAMYA